MPKNVRGESGPCLEIPCQGRRYRTYPPDYAVFYTWVEMMRDGERRCYERRIEPGGRLGMRLRRIVQEMIKSGRIAA